MCVFSRFRASKSSFLHKYVFIATSFSSLFRSGIFFCVCVCVSPFAASTNVYVDFHIRELLNYNIRRMFFSLSFVVVVVATV